MCNTFFVYYTWLNDYKLLATARHAETLSVGTVSRVFCYAFEMEKNLKRTSRIYGIGKTPNRKQALKVQFGN